MIKLERKNDKVVYDNFYWTMKARFKKNEGHRWRMDYLFANGEQIFCTNTRALHIYDYALDAGNYEIIKCTKSEAILNRVGDLECPDISRFLEESKDDAEPLDPIYIHHEYAKVIRKHLSGTINFSYFQDAIEDMDSFKWPESNKPLYLFNGVKRALIMPILSR
jgi:hypothetical protein